ncbi:hypothetical protein ACFOOM_24495 [Streptomyces echinoruber]|uniref:Guanylate cyclase domain-containing protein n=1 Tax=Streptomyces echinoruber TaxID=68898 RepID=A0A918R6N5_9ACTN|nr:hypothetical protein [Streptomyces echinoruber]GGZ87238.1 hypothetical protein GCM10010389_26990 [Streptomyces echinoruber]
MNHGAPELAEAHYESVISVDARRSGEYDDIDKTHLRARIYRVLQTAFEHAAVPGDALHMEDRGDGVLVSVAGRVSVSRLLGLWLVEVHEKLRDENRGLRRPLGLRIGMHVGPVRHDERGISGRAVDLACRLADSAVARRLLDAEDADLVLMTSQSLYEDVVSSGGKFIDPARYSPVRLRLKEGEVTAWCHLPGRPAPTIRTEAAPDAEAPTPDAEAPTPAAEAPAPAAEAPAPETGTPAPGEVGGAPDATDSAPAAGRRPSDAGPPAAGAPTGPAGSSTHINVGRDFYEHRDNVYHQPVHIGPVVNRDGGQRKGRAE